MLKAWVWTTEKVHAIVHDKRGVTALEYGVLASAILLAIAAIVVGMGKNLSNVFTGINAQL